MGLRIDVISYLDPDAGTGGGELIVRELLREGAARGHELRGTHRYPAPRFDAHEEPDFTLLVDVWNLPGHWGRADRRLRDRLRPASPGARYRRLVERAIARGRFLHHDNAYVDLCVRPYLPCSGRMAAGGRCSADTGGRCGRLRDPRLYRDAAAISFLSPLHARVATGMLGHPLPPVVVLRPLIDPARFRARSDAVRDLDRLYIGPLVEGKGARELQRRYPDGDVWCVSGGPEPLRRRMRPGRARPVRFGRQLERVPHEQVPALLNRARSFVFLPRWPEPQGRVVVEAALCGCELEVNENVGALSFGLAPDDPALCEGAASEWWERVEELAAA